MGIYLPKLEHVAKHLPLYLSQEFPRLKIEVGTQGKSYTLKIFGQLLLSEDNLYVFAGRAIELCQRRYDLLLGSEIKIFKKTSVKPTSFFY